MYTATCGYLQVPAGTWGDPCLTGYLQTYRYLTCGHRSPVGVYLYESRLHFLVWKYLWVRCRLTCRLTREAPYLILGDQTNLLLSLTTTQPCHPRTHHHQRHRRRRGRDRLFVDQQPVMCDAWQQACRIWDLQSRKGVMLQSCYLIIIQTIFLFNATLDASFITFLCHCA